MVILIKSEFVLGLWGSALLAVGLRDIQTRGEKGYHLRLGQQRTETRDLDHPIL